MIQRIKDRLHSEDKGFTLIELMVVVLIIAILIAIAIPTFLGARTRAQDRAAQSSLRNTVTAAKALFTDNEDYAAATVAALTSGEPSLSFVAAGVASTKSTEVSSANVVTAPSTKAEEFYGAVMSSSGTCWFVRDAVDPASNPGTGWAKDTDNSGACTGTRASGIADATWVKEPGNSPEV
ncbi:MAG: prepilin-type N-terminal cleavage/methylation domain-containing protein [Actinomycetota bacterium]